MILASERERERERERDRDRDRDRDRERETENTNTNVYCTRPSARVKGRGGGVRRRYKHIHTTKQHTLSFSSTELDNLQNMLARATRNQNTT